MELGPAATGRSVNPDDDDDDVVVESSLREPARGRGRMGEEPDDAAVEPLPLLVLGATTGMGVRIEEAGLGGVADIGGKFPQADREAEIKKVFFSCYDGLVRV